MPPLSGPDAGKGLSLRDGVGAFRLGECPRSIGDEALAAVALYLQKDCTKGNCRSVSRENGNEKRVKVS